MPPKVSLLVCCYNGEKYIDSCFSCILNQTYTNIEVLFVNDGSKDHSLQKAESYRAKLEQNGFSLKTFSQENKGAGFAASLGLQHATGEYITTFDVDDFLYSDAIEEKLRFLEMHPDYAIVRTNGYEIKNNKDRKLFVMSKREKEEISIFHSLLFGKTNNWSGSYMVRSTALWKVYKNHFMPGSRFGQNLQLLLAASYENKSGFIDRSLMAYVRNEESFTGNKTTFEEQYRLLEGFYSIKQDILDVLNVHDINIKKDLTLFYTHKKLQLSIDFHEREPFVENFNVLKKNRYKISFLEKYYYYHFKGNHMVSFYYRILFFVSRFFCLQFKSHVSR